MDIKWDPRKADANLADHGVSFAEAVTVLEDDFALTRENPDAVGDPLRHSGNTDSRQAELAARRLSAVLDSCGVCGARAQALSVPDNGSFLSPLSG